MQGPVGTQHRKFFRRSPTLRTARARRPRPTTRRTAGGPLCPGIPGPDARRGTGRADAVNSPTTRHASPAAATRTGRGESAPPHPDQGTKIQLPFAALPHQLRKDPRLKGNRTAIVLAAALLEYAPGSKPSCYPTNATLASDLGCSESTVRAALAALRAAGWIRVVLGPRQPNGRRIWLCWRETSVPRLSDTRQSASTLPRSVGPTPRAIGPEEEIVIEENREETNQFAHSRSRLEPSALLAALPPAPPPSCGARAARPPERAAKTALVPPLLAVPAPVPAQAPEVGPREARPAILVTPAGPTHQAEVDPVPGGVAAPAGVNQCPDPAGDPRTRLARSQSELHPELDSPALAAAPDAPRSIPVPPAGPAPHRSPAPHPSPREASSTLPLTPEQQARLEALPEATANLVLTWLLTGDRILVAEAKKKLAPPRPRPEAPRTLPEVLGRIREDPSFPALAADWLSSSLEDRKSYSGFKARCEEAWRGELNPARLVSAYEQATGPKARNRGAIFMVAVRQKE